MMPEQVGVYGFFIVAFIMLLYIIYRIIMVNKKIIEMEQKLEKLKKL